MKKKDINTVWHFLKVLSISSVIMMSIAMIFNWVKTKDKEIKQRYEIISNHIDQGEITENNGVINIKTK